MRKLLLIVLSFALLCMGAVAADLPIGQEGVYSAVPQQAAGLLDPGPQSSFGEGLAQIMQRILPTLSQAVRDAVKSAGIMLCALLLCAIAGETGGVDPTRIAGVLCICMAAMLRVDALASAGIEALQQMRSFADVLLPAMTAGTAAAGGVTASTAIYAGTALFGDVLMHLMGELLLPAIYAYTALRAGQALCESELLDRLAGLIRWLFQGGVKLILFIFTSYLGITGLVSGASDATIVKAAKLTLSGVVPVVGSMISDASETVIAGAAAVRNALGVFGMLAVIAICIGPFLNAAVQFLILKAASAAGGALGQPRLLALMDAICEAMGFLLSLLAASALMLLVCCVCYLKVSPA